MPPAALTEGGVVPATPMGQHLLLLAQSPGVQIDRALFAAFASAAAPNSLRAFRGDVLAFDGWCRRQGACSLPANARLVAQYLQMRADAGAAPASLGRLRASLAKLHRLCGLPDPCGDELVKLTFAAHRRAVGSAQKQARPLRFRGSVKDPLADPPRGLNVRAALAALGDSLTDIRDKALLSVAYDTGLRASELVAIEVGHIAPAIDPDARLLHIARSKGDQEGEGATAYLSPRSARALDAWLEASGIREGHVFRRVMVRHYKARPARKRTDPASIAGNARWRPERFAARPAVPARIETQVGEGPLHPGSITPLLRSLLRRAYAAGAFADLDAATFAAQLAQVSAHSTRVGVNQDYFAAGEDLAGIMDALRWKSPRMPLQYNRNLAAEQGAAGRMLGKLG